MPSNFKGTRVELEYVTVEGRSTGPVIKVSVQFCDAEGVVHAVTHHILEPSVDPNLTSTVKPFMEAVRMWVEQLHYTDAGSPVLRKVSTGGIAEALRESSDQDDGDGEQG